MVLLLPASFGGVLTILGPCILPFVFARADRPFLRSGLPMLGGMLKIVREEEPCRRLMSTPGVGPITALAFRATTDRPDRFGRSRDVGAHLDLIRDPVDQTGKRIREPARRLSETDIRIPKGSDGCLMASSCGGGTPTAKGSV